MQASATARLLATRRFCLFASSPLRSEEEPGFHRATFAIFRDSEFVLKSTTRVGLTAA